MNSDVCRFVDTIVYKKTANHTVNFRDCLRRMDPALMVITNTLLLVISVILPLTMFATPNLITLTFLGMAIIGIGILRRKDVL